jgi:hypothetical protein
VADLSVRVQAPGFVLDVSTDSQGVFMATEVPSGPVTIKSALDDRFTIVQGSMSGAVPEGGCVPLTLRAALNGRIRGKVTGRDGKPSAGVLLQLSVSNDVHRFGIQDRFQTRTSGSGEFEFRALPPGQYLLGHNLYPESDIGPVPKGPPMFYPGTSDRAAAVPIVVGEGTEHTGLDFVVVP